MFGLMMRRDGMAKRFKACKEYWFEKHIQHIFRALSLSNEIITLLLIILIIKSTIFLDCDWFKKLLFSTNSLAKLLSDSLLLDSSISQSHSKFL